MTTYKDKTPVQTSGGFKYEDTPTAPKVEVPTINYKDLKTPASNPASWKKTWGAKSAIDKHNFKKKLAADRQKIGKSDDSEEEGLEKTDDTPITIEQIRAEKSVEGTPDAFKKLVDSARESIKQQKQALAQQTMQQINMMDKSDNDSQVAGKDLAAITHHVSEFQQGFDPNQDQPDWVDNKLHDAATAVADAAHYHEARSGAPEKLSKMVDCLRGGMAKSSNGISRKSEGEKRFKSSVKSMYSIPKPGSKIDPDMNKSQKMTADNVPLNVKVTPLDKSNKPSPAERLAALRDAARPKKEPSTQAQVDTVKNKNIQHLGKDDPMATAAGSIKGAFGGGSAPSTSSGGGFSMPSLPSMGGDLGSSITAGINNVMGKADGLHQGPMKPIEKPSSKKPSSTNVKVSPAKKLLKALGKTNPPAAAPLTKDVVEFKKPAPKPTAAPMNEDQKYDQAIAGQTTKRTQAGRDKAFNSDSNLTPETLNWAMNEMHTSGHGDVANKMKTGELSHRQAADILEDRNHKGLAAALRSKNGDDIQTLMHTERAHNDFDLNGRKEQFESEREGALDAKYLSNKNSRDLHTNRYYGKSGQVSSSLNHHTPINAMLYMHNNGLEGSSTAKELAAHMTEPDKKAHYSAKIKEDRDHAHQQASEYASGPKDQHSVDYETRNPGFHAEVSQDYKNRAAKLDELHTKLGYDAMDNTKNAIDKVATHLKDGKSGQGDKALGDKVRSLLTSRVQKSDWKVPGMVPDTKDNK